MYLITGATGNTGSVVAKGLLKQGKKVRVVARSQEKLKELASLGAEILIGDITSQSTASKVFTGVEAAYVMIPPAMTDPDFRGYQQRLTDVYGSALEANSSVKHVVVLSSFGADKDAKTGPILGLHFLEERLKEIKPLNSLALRAGYFMENTLGQAAVIHQMGVVVGPLKPDLKIPLIASIDVGNAALNALLQLNFTGHQTHDLQGQRDLTYFETTAIIGAAIGKPDLQYHLISSEQFAGFIEQMGWAKNVAVLIGRNGRRSKRRPCLLLGNALKEQYDAHALRAIRIRNVRSRLQGRFLKTPGRVTLGHRNPNRVEAVQSNATRLPMTLKRLTKEDLSCSSVTG